jgi:hypothetical protein
MKDERVVLTSELSPDGYVTPEVSLRWVASIVSRACTQGGAEGARIYVYAYRHPTDYLAVDIVASNDSKVSLTFHTGGRTLLDDTDPCVTDLAEAIQLTGLIAQSMGLRVDLGRPVEPEDLAVTRSRISEDR